MRKGVSKSSVQWRIFSVDETWVGVINPDLTKQPMKQAYLNHQHYFDEEMIEPLKWVDGTRVNDNKRSRYKYHSGLYCQKFDNSDYHWGNVPDGMQWHVIRNLNCDEMKQVICQYDCNNIHRRGCN